MTILQKFTTQKMDSAPILNQYIFASKRYEKTLSGATMVRRALEHRSLRQFMAVVEAGSVRKAASRINVSQPPLTQAIRKLERDLGITLFERRAKGMALTEAGEILARDARSILSQIEKAERRMDDVRHGVRPLRIGFVSAALTGCLTDILQALAKAGQASPALYEMTTPHQVDALSRGTLDIGLLHPPVSLEGNFEIVALGRDPFVAAVPETHPLAACKALTFEQVVAQPLVLFPRDQGPSLYGAIERLAFAAGTELRIAAQATRVHTQLAIVSGGLGLGLVSYAVAESLTFRGVLYRPISGIEEQLFLQIAFAASTAWCDWYRNYLIQRN